MRLAVEPWAPEYGSPTEEGGFTPQDPPVLDLELAPQDWEPLSPGGAPVGIVYFVDGVHRIEARLVVTLDSGEARRGRCVSVRARGSRVLQRPGHRRRGPGSPTSSWLPDKAARTSPLATAPSPTTWCLRRLGPGQGPSGPHGRPRGRGARSVAPGADDLVITDGPLSRPPARAKHAVGYVKTHPMAVPARGPVPARRHRAPPGPAHAGLPPRGAAARPGTSACPRRRPRLVRRRPLRGRGRGQRPRPFALADRVTAALPRFASEGHKDPRAPQNLYPIGGLEKASSAASATPDSGSGALRAHVPPRRLSPRSGFVGAAVAAGGSSMEVRRSVRGLSGTLIVPRAGRSRSKATTGAGSTMVVAIRALVDPPAAAGPAVTPGERRRRPRRALEGEHGVRHPVAQGGASGGHLVDHPVRGSDRRAGRRCLPATVEGLTTPPRPTWSRSELVAAAAALSNGPDAGVRVRQSDAGVRHRGAARGTGSRPAGEAFLGSQVGRPDAARRRRQRRPGGGAVATIGPGQAEGSVPSGHDRRIEACRRRSGPGGLGAMAQAPAALEGDGRRGEHRDPKTTRARTQVLSRRVHGSAGVAPVQHRLADPAAGSPHAGGAAGRSGTMDVDSPSPRSLARRRRGRPRGHRRDRRPRGGLPAAVGRRPRPVTRRPAGVSRPGWWSSSTIARWSRPPPPCG